MQSPTGKSFDFSKAINLAASAAMASPQASNGTPTSTIVALPAASIAAATQAGLPPNCSISTIEFPIVTGVPAQVPFALPTPIDFAAMQQQLPQAAGPIDPKALLAALMGASKMQTSPPPPPSFNNSALPQVRMSVLRSIIDCFPDVKADALAIEGNLTISVPGQPPLRIDFPAIAPPALFPQVFPLHTPAITPAIAKPTFQPVLPKPDAPITPSSASHNKRKAYQPIKMDCNGTPSPPSTSAAPPSAHPSHQYSGSTSPESGVLDLSRTGSMAGSAPITPLKADELHPLLPSPFTCVPIGLLEACQRQLKMMGTVPTMVGQFSTQQQTPTKRRRINPPTRRSNSSKKFKCNQCRQEFNSLHALEEHTRVEHETYRCTECNAKFTQRSNLQRHSLKHVGFKPFRCNVCMKSYFRKDHLMRHMEQHHPDISARDNITVLLTSSESLDYLANRAEADEPIDVAQPSNESLDETLVEDGPLEIVADEEASGADEATTVTTSPSLPAEGASVGDAEMEAATEKIAEPIDDKAEAPLTTASI